MLKINGQNVFITSDTHYNHKNICRGTSEWKGFEEGSSHQSTRDFQTLEEMNQVLIDGINHRVGVKDVLIFCGDWSFGGVKSIFDFRKQLKVKTIHYIYGNHCQHIEKNTKIFLTEEEDIDAAYDLGVLMSDLDNPTQRFWVYPQDLFTSCQHYLEAKIDQKHFIFFHYSMRVWNKSHHGSILCYGHSHGSIENVPWGKSMDVGVDNCYRLFKQYRPFNINEVKSILKSRPVNFVDHHQKDTN